MAYLMIVDDDEDFAAVAAAAMLREGHQVAVKSDTAKALTEMQSRPPDLVILDVMFPGDDFAGFELARAMRESSNLKLIPILMLTGINQRFDMDFSALDIDSTWLPVTDFLRKPVDPGELVRKVKALLHSAGALGESHPLT
jgi:two-component system alkaline phosphatase synthesis response regulator PhoP